jgi:hypothetical protein
MPFGLFEKAPEITMTVDRPQGPYFPGDVIHVSIQTKAEKDSKINGVRASLVLRTRYKENQQQTDTTTKQTTTVQTDVSAETEVDKQQPMGAGSLHGDQTFTADLHIPPDAAPPYSSTLIETHWVVKATIDRPMAGDPNQEMELPLIVAPRGTYSQPGEFGNSSDLNVAALRFSLPKLEFVNGETLQGKLLIEPHQNFDVREVRLELFCRESVNEGNTPNTSETTDQKIQLAGSMKMQSGQAVSYPFTFIVAPKGRPTFQSPKAQVHWVLKASLDRAFAGDAVVEQELFVYRGARQS